MVIKAHIFLHPRASNNPNNMHKLNNPAYTDKGMVMKEDTDRVAPNTPEVRAVGVVGAAGVLDIVDVVE